MKVKNQRCTDIDERGQQCPRYVSAEWDCIECGKRVCKQHSQSVTFGNFGNEGAACLCFSCMQQLIQVDSSQIGRQRAKRTYRQMLELAMKRQNHNFVAIAQEFLNSPTSKQDPEMRKAMEALITLEGGLQSNEE